MGYVGRKPTDAALTSSDIAPGAVDTANLAADAVTTAKIAPATVAAADIAPATITTTQIAPNTVAASNIAPGTITSTQISPAVTLGIPVASSDPTPLSIGDVFFNSTSEELKVATTTAGGWAAEADSPYGHTQSVSAGNASAFVVSGMYGSPTGAPTLSFINDTIEFNGTSWSAAGSSVTFNPGYGFGAGTGTQTAALAFGGWGAPYQTATGEYDGSTWSSGGALSSGRYSNCGGGVQSDAFTAGGRGPSGSPFTSVEEYNGTSWSSGTAIPTAQRDYFGGGVATSSGWISRETSGHFSYDGSTWSTLTSNPVAQVGGGAGNSGPQSDHVLIGHQSPSYSTNVQLWNGSAWSAYTNYPEVTGNGSMGMSGGTTGGIHNAGGAPSVPGYSNTTVEKTAPSITAKVVTIS